MRSNREPTDHRQQLEMRRVRARRRVPMLQDRRILWHSGPHDLVCTRISELTRSGRVPLHKELSSQSGVSANRVDGISSVHLEMCCEQGVINEILSNFGKCNNRLDAEFLELARVADPAKHQELWRVDRSCGKNNFFLCTKSVRLSYMIHAGQ